VEETQTSTSRNLSNWEQIHLQDGTVARRYPDGSIRNERGHPIPGTKIPNNGHEITHENARAFASRRLELKRETIAAAANEAVARADFKQNYGDMAYIAELGYYAQLKAQNIDDPKQIDAARFLIQETGIAEARTPETVNNTMNVIGVPPEIIHALTELHDRLLDTRSTILATDNDAHSSVVDGSPTDESEAK